MPASCDHPPLVGFAGARRTANRAKIVGLAGLATLAGLIALPGLFRTAYTPGSDDAVIELGVRHALHGVVEVGAYSRFGWFHPGPASYYLLAVPYVITGEHSAGILLGALIINSATLVAITLVLYRRVGAVAALFALVALLAMLRAMPVNLLADPWNPYLPILPLVLLVVLSWCAVAGDHRFLPVLPVLASLCIQVHVGFVPPCLFVLATVVAFLAVRRQRPRISWRRWSAWGAVLVLVWALPLYEQLSRSNGNLTALWRYFTARHTALPWSFSWHVLTTELGRFPAYLFAVHPQQQYVVPPRLPTWTAAVTVGVFASTVALAVVRRYRDVIEFAVFTAVMCLAALVAVRQVRGLLSEYLVQWTSVTGGLAWITVGLGVARLMQDAWVSRWRGRFSMRRVGQMLVAAALAIAVVLALLLGVQAGRSRPTNEPDAAPVAAQLHRWLAAHPATAGQPIVGLLYQGCTRPSFMCVGPAGMALVDQLVRRGVHALPDQADVWTVRPLLPFHGPIDVWLLLGFAHGGSPPPPPGWHQVAASANLIVYARA